jgi:asparagine synthase (glutamine-hydrolysing)
MCGITGIVSKHGVDRNILGQMTARLTHRGPDAQGIFVDDEDQIGLGHTRLSIIDLSEAANQPFHSQDRRYVIVYNGEIYNFQKLRAELQTKHNRIFRTNSDTEVLIEGFAVWGADLCQRIEGMFAFCILDKLEHKLYFFRDRFGKKPLYYYYHDNLFLFGSEIKSILSHPVALKAAIIRKEVISTFLQLGYLPEPETFFCHIRKFPAGHFGVLDANGKLEITSFWNIIDSFHRTNSISPGQAKKVLRTKIESAVVKRLVSDVPVGVFLSGGIDSSLVTALATTVSSETVKTFTIGSTDRRHDESIFAEKIARYLKTDHHNFTLSEKEVAEMINIYLGHFHEPFADTSAIPTMLVSMLARKEVTVALTGDGGDELFLGYGAYTWAERLQNPFMRAARPLIRMALTSLPSSRFNRASHMFEKIPDELRRQHIFSQEQYLFSEQEIINDLLLHPEIQNRWRYDEDETVLGTLSESEKQALFDLQFYLKDDLLVKVDRASMYSSLECRCPLLDDEVVEYALNLPVKLRKKGSETKHLPREILFDMIPRQLFDRPKQGFSIPMKRWLRGELRFLMDFLTKEKIEETDVFKYSYVQDLQERFFSGEEYLYNRLWAMIIIQKFLLNQNG